MALVYPFRGIRYNKETIGDFQKVVTQPYDKMTPSMQDEYYRCSPFNVVRITLNLENRTNPETRYPDAGSIFLKWIAEKVLLQDSLPAMYAYYQEYAFEGQTRLQKGFISLLDLKNSESGIIPHENTLAAPKQDRLRLLRSIEANEDLIYLLYSDDRLTVNRIMDESISGRPAEIEVKDEYGAVHRVWAITDPETLRKMQDSMRSQRLFIADGHHRFETSINFMNECREKGWEPAGLESFDKRMVTCFNSVDGVTILPTHRMIRDLPEFDPGTFLRKIEDHFEAEPVSSASALWEKMKKGQRDNVFGFYPATLRKFYFLRLRKNVEVDRRLDVSVLHSLLLERLLGIDESKLASQAHLDYMRERDLCIKLVDEGKYQAAFFLNPTTAEQMQQIASRGERMPQKSTDFFPKLLAGLIFMQMKIAKQ
ncbi:MAG: DUF1015 domain-containing protein [Acidobacteriota bacterium]